MKIVNIKAGRYFLSFIDTSSPHNNSGNTATTSWKWKNSKFVV